MSRDEDVAATASLRYPLLSARGIALLLIATGGDMTPEADRIVEQATWDALFDEGYARTSRPLHGDAFTVLTPQGVNELENMILEWEGNRGDV